ncbi:uncharacterized protein V6R79_026227 [Siganus canaliculatus]
MWVLARGVWQKQLMNTVRRQSVNLTVKSRNRHTPLPTSYLKFIVVTIKVFSSARCSDISAKCYNKQWMSSFIVTQKTKSGRPRSVSTTLETLAAAGCSQVWNFCCD